MRQVVYRAAAGVLVSLAAGVALAQNPPPRPPPGMQGMPGMQDTARMPMRPGARMRPGMMMRGGEGAEQLRREIEERFGRRVQMELELNDQQMDRLRAAARTNQDRRRDLERREQDLHRAVMQQLQPGVAANQDSLARLLDAIAANQVAKAQLGQQELRELGFLTPVQRARLILMRHQLMERMEEIRERFRPGMGPRGMGPGMREPDEPEPPLPELP